MYLLSRIKKNYKIHLHSYLKFRYSNIHCRLIIRSSIIHCCSLSEMTSQFAISFFNKGDSFLVHSWSLCSKQVSDLHIWQTPRSPLHPLGEVQLHVCSLLFTLRGFLSCFCSSFLDDSGSVGSVIWRGIRAVDFLI